MKTTKLIDHIKASAKIYAAQLDKYDSLSDAELATTFDRMRGGSIARALNSMSAAAIERAFNCMRNTSITRAIDNMSDTSITRVFSVMSDASIARIFGNMSAAWIACALGRMSDALSARVLRNMSDAAVARVNIEVPIVEDLDKRILSAVGSEGENLDMSNWHYGTGRCRAGWAIVLAGEAGEKLESIGGRHFAGRCIYEASTGRPAPDFFASNSDALADIRACAVVGTKLKGGV